MISIVQSFEIDAAHRIHGHENKCKHLHGHRYKFEIHLKSKDEGLDPLGRVIDFSRVKTLIGNWLNYYWDHGTILWMDDPIASLWKTGGSLDEHKIFLIPGPPTAENLSDYLLSVANGIMQMESLLIQVTKVVCWETPNCRAIATLEENRAI